MNARSLVCAALIGLFLWNVSQFYLPGKGFTYLIEFGDQEHARYIPALKATNHYEMPNSHGYDAQWYAQIAMDPHLGDKALSKALDSLPYRARRILFSWTAWVFAGGNPALAMHLYAIQNIVAWVLLALLLFRWFPPSTWGNVFRWTGVMYSFGLCFSVRGALTDGPSLLLIAIGMALLESGWPWMAALFLGISGLGKETNVLAAAANGPFPPKTGREWTRLVSKCVVVGAPLLIWAYLLHRWLGHGGDAGARNFAPPLSGFVGKCIEIGRQMAAADSNPLTKYSVFTLVALITQFLFFLLVPQWKSPWWRLGVAYAGLMVILGDAVWEGYPGAASRVLLPMMLAFNILVPRGRKWWVILILGNLTLLASTTIMNPPGRESFAVEGAREYRIVADTGATVEAVYDDHWYLPERSRLEFFRWSRGDADIAFRNPHPFPLDVTITFGLRSIDARKVTVSRGTTQLWAETLKPRVLAPVSFEHFRMEPGDTVLHFATDLAGRYPENVLSSNDLRLITFSIRDLTIDIKGPASKVPAGK